jgi:membrane associated rhomboid family serine protease
MYPIRDNYYSKEMPVVTYTLVGLNILLYLWDRNWNPFGPSVVFADLAMKPTAVIDAIRGHGSALPIATIFTSFFLHANLLHLIGNLVFLVTFGDNVEHALGGPRFTLYYLFWGIVAACAHIFVMHGSDAPTLGASGAIGGVLGAYFLLFPGNRITMIVFPLVFLPFVVSAWILLGLWFLWQILLPQAGVANWAHAGGFMAGMATVLIMGGRDVVLKNTHFIRDNDAELA